MLRLAFASLVFALIAGVLGFSGMAAAATYIAQLLFFVFLALFVCTSLAHLGNKKKPPN